MSGQGQKENEIKIPAIMATQHPDAASRYVSIQEEPEEAINALTPLPQGLGYDEIMIDFEGKLTPYQQTSQIVLGLLSKNIVPGRDVRVTPRIPSGREEGIFRQLMALMSIVESNYHSFKQARIEGINEVVLPMTTQAKELLNLKQRILDVIDLAHKEFGLSKDPASLNIIPLFESIPPVLQCGKILSEYRKGLRLLNADVSQIRVMLGCSDLALSYGMPAAMFTIKVALNQMRKLQKETGIEILPILGGGTLPFRGFVSHENAFLFEDFPGIKTVTAQSALRYDYSENESRQFVAWVNENVKENKEVPLLGEADIKTMLNFSGCFAFSYLSAFSQLIPLAISIADLVPGQRDRLARKSEVGYARDVAHPDQLAGFLPDKNLALQLKSMKIRSAELPRAISFTAALYSIGLPPEIIGTGRGIAMIKARYGNSALADLDRLYPGLRTSLKAAGRFLNFDIAKQFLENDILNKIEKDIFGIENLLEIKMGPEKKADNFYSTMVETMKPMLKQIIGDESFVSEEDLEVELVKEWVIKLGKIRKALG
jgi:phosphoenolpyruvate carboxylase